MEGQKLIEEAADHDDENIGEKLQRITDKYEDLFKKYTDLVAKYDEELIEKHENLVKKHAVQVEKYEVLVKENKGLLDDHKDLVEKHEELVGKHEKLVQQLRDKVECPVCLDIPKKAPIPVCPNGHVVCNKCVKDECPTCRARMGQGKSSLAVTVIENIEHECENEGCDEKLSYEKLVSHGKSCLHRPVDCPDLHECKKKIPLASLPTHLVSCCLRQTKIESYEMPFVVWFAYSPSDNKGDETWKLVAMRFDEHIFVLKIAARYNKSDDEHRWFFMVQMLGGEEETLNYRATIIVHRHGDNPEEEFSLKYCGGICSIDMTGEKDADKKGLCLTLTDGAMKRFFVDVDQSDIAFKKKFPVSVDIHKRAMKRFFVDVDPNDRASKKKI